MNTVTAGLNLGRAFARLFLQADFYDVLVSGGRPVAEGLAPAGVLFLFIMFFLSKIATGRISGYLFDSAMLGTYTCQTWVFPNIRRTDLF